jgi:hypothetical protein
MNCRAYELLFSAWAVLPVVLSKGEKPAMRARFCRCDNIRGSHSANHRMLRRQPCRSRCRAYTRFNRYVMMHASR